MFITSITISLITNGVNNGTIIMTIGFKLI